MSNHRNYYKFPTRDWVTRPWAPTHAVLYVGLKNPTKLVILSCDIGHYFLPICWKVHLKIENYYLKTYMKICVDEKIYENTCNVV